ncbi:MAG: TMEM175 family protein [Gemmatimonadota bacterium]
MDTKRLEAFSDGVIAIIITIMVLELRAPHDPSFGALRELYPVFLSYVLSFVYLAIYWNNHHHMIHATRQVSGGILWANMHLLFWLSVVPFTTAWMGENHFAPAPTALYGVNLLLAAISYTILQNCIVAVEGKDSTLGTAVGSDRKGRLSLVAYLLAIALSFVMVWAAGLLYVLVALLWLVPDPRIERAMKRE